MEKEGNNPQQIHSNVCSCLVSLVLSTILIMFLLFCSLFFFFPPVSESSWPVLILTIPIVLLSTLFLLVTLRKKKGSKPEEDGSLVQEMKMQKEELQTEIALIDNEQEAESQSDSSFPSDSETTSCSAMDEKFELNASKITTTSLPSDAETESINGETESLELDQNSTRVLGIYESSDSENEEEDDDDDLIEINLPSSNFCGLGKELGQRLESKLPDFLPEAMFKQEGLMELLAEINEMNEDENLIEIDISMGVKQEMPFSGGDLDQYSYSVVTD
ncbi:hypothetical protein QN277_018429 [Acacia crassicarpa]|uniref:Transmembrane protein n=1 Tax=Acacia crassicarpa TaxID=499986 RepID=A0AAE1JVS6_9FABA|nr:hypothetical protein QN277_018429 [Acacia crassicarpa]